MNDPRAAILYAEKARELAPTDPGVADTLGWCYFGAGLYDLAVKYLEESTVKGATSVRKYHLAMAYAKRGDRDKAKLLLRELLSRDPSLLELRNLSHDLL